MNRKAGTFLKRDYLKNIDMLDLLAQPGVDMLVCDDGGVLLRFSVFYQLSCAPGEAARFLPLLTEGLAPGFERIIVLHDDALVPVLTQSFGFSLLMTCVHAVYERREPVAFSLPEGCDIRPLEMEHFAFVRANYRTIDDDEYVRARLNAGMFGIFMHGEPAGFIGTHAERSIGLLEVAPRFRRHGFAFALEAYMINHLLSQGRVPFCQVAIGNRASLALQKKLGMSFSKDTIYWLGR